MPDLLLLDTDVVVADAWHRVTAPGGYETWYFDAQDEHGSVFVVAAFHAGFTFHPEYLRRFHLYQRNPTRHTPPSPMEYCCVHLAVYENGRRCGGFTRRYAAGQFAASTSEVKVRIGPHHLSGGDDGLQLHLGYSDDLPGLSADLSFKPSLMHPPAEKIFLSRHPSYTDHHFWLVANPLCQVKGEINLPTGRKIGVSGQGYHDHCYGTGPAGGGLSRWMCGRVLLEDRALAFQIATPDEPQGYEQAHLFMADRTAAGAVATARTDLGNDRSSGWGLCYPVGVDIGQSLILRQPRVMDSSPYFLRLSYDAFVDGEAARAFCQIVYPQRLRWPVLGRFIERSIEAG